MNPMAIDVGVEPGRDRARVGPLMMAGADRIRAGVCAAAEKQRERDREV
jgi:hypothetical protein